MRAEVLFVNTKEFTVKWGTKNPISIPTQSAATSGWYAYKSISEHLHSR